MPKKIVNNNSSTISTIEIMPVPNVETNNVIEIAQQEIAATQQASNLDLKAKDWTHIGDEVYGSKFDNLVEVGKALGVEYVSLNFELSDKQIVSLFSKETLILWNELCCSANSLDPEYPFRTLNSKFEILQVAIEKDILTSEIPYTPEQIETTCKFHGKLIIRSNSEEDKKLVNAGVYKTIEGVIPDEHEVLVAVAEVVASYFSYDSFVKRRHHENPFEKLPSCSVIVMEQIIESEDDPQPIVSGVVMSHKPDWSPIEEGRVTLVTASWGFGGGIVAGQVASDQWLLADGQCYPTIRNKTQRQAVQEGRAKTVPNEPGLREKPSLSPEQLQKLNKAVQKIEAHFKRPMDIEFVIKNDRLYIVQARPIHALEISKANYFDRSQIYENTERFDCETILAGENKVLSIMKSMTNHEVLFAKDLEEADKQKTSQTKVIFINTPPEACNTHAEVNLVSQKPPPACLLMSYENWSRCYDILENTYIEKYVQVCPQSETVYITSQELPVKEGLILHPAKVPVSIDYSNKPFVGNSAHPKLQVIKKLLNADPEALTAHLERIDETLEEIFNEISGRSSVKASLASTLPKVRQFSQNILKVMKHCSAVKTPTHLSLHASILRHLMYQTNTSLIGAHTISGLEKATNIPKNIEQFLELNQDSEMLCELALISQKAYLENVKKNWLDFLSKHKGNPSLEILHNYVLELDVLKMLPLWFSANFANHANEFDAILVQREEVKDFLKHCLVYANKIKDLSFNLESVTNEKQLTTSWDKLKDLSSNFIISFESHSTLNIFQELLLAMVLADLIQLWDNNIKVIRTSKILETIKEAQEYNSRITQFAEFGINAIAKNIINYDKKYELMKLLEEMKDKVVHIMNFEVNSKFSVYHWLVPLGQTGEKIRTNDERFTIIHQNLVQASGPKISEDLLKLIPSKLATAVRIFEKENPLTPRFSSKNAKFLSVSGDKVTITIHIPLNYHSFVVTFSHKEACSDIEVTAYWKASDNDQVANIDYFEVLELITDVKIKSYCPIKSDLKVVFAVNNDKQFELLSRAISDVNYQSLHTKNYFESMVDLLHPVRYDGEKFQSDKDWESETAPTAKLLDEVLWKQYVETDKLPTRFYHNIEKVLKKRPIEEQKEVVWNKLTSPGCSIKPYNIPKAYRDELLIRFYKEAPEKAKEYFKRYSTSIYSRENFPRCYFLVER